ncbi:hypothetical protein [Silvibacterium acidisoli]|uniref:hypothetical protein n=1 Tax=Acidobacteriaceae bacterium ZG23-2 TaxID=2883246 RepID=UPI00406D0D60
MTVKALCKAALLFLAPLPLVAAGLPQAQFTLSERTLVPGATLPPGSYSITLLDQLKDRYIVRIDATQGSDKATFIGIRPKRSLESTKRGAVAWQSAADGQSALRGFSFGRGEAVEFVYPKNDAVALAKANGKPVAAVDPESEGHSPQLSGLSQDEMQLITLWLLTPTHVGPGIQAAKLSEVASAKPQVKSLPHTASDTPVILLGGVLTLLAAATLTTLRLSARKV